MRLEESERQDFYSYRVFGLNIFLYYFPELNDEKYTPFLQFIGEIASRYEIICLIGSLSIKDRIGERSMKEFLGNGISYHETPLSFYNGSFYDGRQYGNPPSILVKCSSDCILVEKFVRTFLQDDAVAFFLFEQGHQYSTQVSEAITHFANDQTFIASILQHAKYLLVPQGDLMYLEVYTKSTDAENELKKAVEKAISFISTTAWYQANKKNLHWDDLTMCYVKNPV